MSDWIVPSWPAPPNVRSLMTTRNGGFSGGSWAGASSGGMNLGLGCGDDLEVVRRNRALLARGLPAEPAWLTQVHGTVVVDAAAGAPVVADAAYTTQPGTVCAILVADCMPVLFTDRRGSRVAAAHAGWRGLLGGVLEATLATAGLVPAETLAWIGPSIGPTCFEVGADVRDAFVGQAHADADGVAAAFRPHAPGKWLADLAGLARLRLERVGVADIRVDGGCTASDARRFYSYRRDGVTGRMAALVWIAH